MKLEQATPQSLRATPQAQANCQQPESRRSDRSRRSQLARRRRSVQSRSSSTLNSLALRPRPRRSSLTTALIGDHSSPRDLVTASAALAFRPPYSVALVLPPSLTLSLSLSLSEYESLKFEMIIMTLSLSLFFNINFYTLSLSDSVIGPLNC